MSVYAKKLLIGAALLQVLSGVALADYTLNIPLTLFDPSHQPPAPTDNGLGTWQPCLVANDAYQPVAADANGNLLPGCQPDTLYSWGNEIKLLELQKIAAGPAAPWTTPFSKMVFTHINPLATIGYGNIAIRMKLKKGVQFVLYTANAISFNNYCTQLIPAGGDVNNTVIVRYWDNQNLYGTDYILCSPGPIDSWSVGTQTHYDELAASLMWNNALPAGSNKWISYSVSSTTNELLNFALDPGTDWTDPTTTQTFQSFQATASAGADGKGYGQIHYAPGSSGDDADHFTSAAKVYWHWWTPTPVAAPAASAQQAPGN